MHYKLLRLCMYNMINTFYANIKNLLANFNKNLANYLGSYVTDLITNEVGTNFKYQSKSICSRHYSNDFSA